MAANPGAALPTVSNADFLAAMFQRMQPGTGTVLVSFAGDPYDDSNRFKWQRRPWIAGRAMPREVIDANNNYTTVSSFYYDDVAGIRRRKKQFARLHGVMFDDVATKIALERIKLIPSARVETSPGNFQDWLFIEWTPAADIRETCERLIEELVAKGLTSDGVDPGMKGVTRVGRLPIGVNGKAKYVQALGGAFACRLVEWRPAFRYTIEEIADAYDLDLTPRVRPPRPEVTEGRRAEAWERFDELVAVFEAAGKYGTAEDDGRHTVSCPWVDAHTDRADSGTALFEPSDENDWVGGFKCHHGHCEQRNVGDVLRWATGRRMQGLIVDLDALEAEQAARTAAEVEALADALPEGAGPVLAGVGAGVGRLRTYAAAEYLARPAPPWIVKGLIPVCELVVVFGAPGTGKSFLVLDLAQSLAAGAAWRGRSVQRRRVLYVAAEGAAGFRNRLAALQQAGRPLDGLEILPAAPSLLDRGQVDLVIDAVRRCRAEFLVVDTLAQTTAGADENSAKDMGAALAACRRIYEATGAPVLLVHHAGKDAAKGARGWSGIKGAVDVEIEVARFGDSRTASTSKVKDGDDGQRFDFKLATVEVGRDEDGDPITSCTVEHVEAAAARRGRRPRGTVEQVALAVVNEVGDLVNGVANAEAVITETARRIVHDSESGRDRRRERARQALQSLAGQGFVTVRGEEVTPC